MSYASASEVAAYTLNLLNGKPMYTEDSNPSRDQVRLFIDLGASQINGHVEAGGYNTPIASGTAAYGIAKLCNIYFAVSQAELVRTTTTVQEGERTRGQVFMGYYQDCVASLLNMDLSQAGADRKSAGRIYVGGATVSGKSTREADTDRVKPSFTRGMHRFDGTLPETSAAS
jgi:hypothetical protein